MNYAEYLARAEAARALERGSENLECTLALEWNEEYGTGVAKVDDQHRAIFAALNELESVLSASEFDRDRATQIIEHIAQDTAEHFAFEEDCMLRYECPAAKSNEAAHKAFLTIVGEFQERIRDEGLSAPLARALHGEAERWIVVHICHTDVHLRACLSKRT